MIFIISVNKIHAILENCEVMTSSTHSFSYSYQAQSINGPGKDRTGDEEEQTEMVWTCG